LRNGCINRILVFLGGADADDITSVVLKILNEIDFTGLVDVVVGNLNPQKEKIQKFCQEKVNYSYHGSVSNIAELMSQADLAIGAGGITTWERACLGLPAIVVILTKNQEESIRDLEDAGAIVAIKKNETEKMSGVLKHLLSDSNAIKKLSGKGLAIMNANAKERGVNLIVKELLC